MNLEIKALLPYSGQIDGLRPLIQSFADALIHHGYANDNERDEIVSLILVKETELFAFTDTDHFVTAEVNDSLFVVIPYKEEEHEHTGD